MNNPIIRRMLALALTIVLTFSCVTAAQAAWLFGFGGGSEANESVLGDVETSAEMPWEGEAAPPPTMSPEDAAALSGSEQVAAPELTAKPSAAPDAQLPQKLATEETSLLRIKLSSLNEPVALGLSFDGQYSVDGDKGFRLAKGTEASVAVDGASLLLTVGGLTIDMGAKVRFVRHEKAAGVYVHENKYDTSYLGDLLLTNENGVIVPIVYMDIDDYLYGVVPFEMSDSWPAEALKAQSVAARTYALARRQANTARAYDVVDTTADQVFRGFNADYENAIKAVDATRYVAGRYNDQYATTYFGASNGGETATPIQIWSYDGDYGYLDQREDPYDYANKNSVVKRLTVNTNVEEMDSGLAKRIRQGVTDRFDGLVDALYVRKIELSDPKMPGTRMYRTLNLTVEIVASTTNEYGEEVAPPDSNLVVVPLDFYGDLKPNFGLKINSADCEVVSVKQERVEGDTNPVAFHIEARRFGHGVGMSQRGAQYMATAEKWTWTQILAFYYPGLTFSQMGFKTLEIQAIEALPASVGYARAKPTPKPTPAPLPALTEGEYVAQTQLATKTSTLNVREQPSTGAKVIDVLFNGQKVIVMQVLDGGWAEIKTAELHGYCSIEYLVRAE